MDQSDYKENSASIIKRYLDIKKYIDIDSINAKISELEKLTANKDFWNNG